jgi:hypothetical protein
MARTALAVAAFVMCRGKAAPEQVPRKNAMTTTLKEFVHQRSAPLPRPTVDSAGRPPACFAGCTSGTWS